MTAIEDISFMLPNYQKARGGIPMVCFTDIPLSESEMHRKRIWRIWGSIIKRMGNAKGVESNKLHSEKL